MKRYHGCDFSHLLTTLGTGHAVDSPSSFVRSYIRPQHSYSLRSCVSHLDGSHVCLLKHPWRSQAVPAPTVSASFIGWHVSAPSVWHSFDFEVWIEYRRTSSRVKRGADECRRWKDHIEVKKHERICETNQYGCNQGELNVIDEQASSAPNHKSQKGSQSRTLISAMACRLCLISTVIEDLS